MRRALTIWLACITLCAPISQAADPDHFKALADYQAVLAKDPANREALRGKIQTLARLGAPRQFLFATLTTTGLRLINADILP